MATLEAATRSAACDAIVDLVDVGGAGTLVFQTSGDVECATLTFSATAFGAASSGVATAAAITSDTSATGGTVAQASFFSGGATKVLEATVTTIAVGTGDILLSSVVIGASDTVSVSSLTVTVPAS